MATLLGCKATYFSSECLGLSLGANSRSKSFWDMVIRRCSKRLATWKANHLPFGGRPTLIQAALNNLLIYFLFYSVPKGVVKELESFVMKLPLENKTTQQTAFDQMGRCL